MNHTDESDCEQEVFDEHRLAQVRAATQENRGDEIGEKRIREPDAGIRRIFRRIVVAIREARDDADMKRQVAEVVQQSGAEAMVVDDDRAIEYFLKQTRDESVDNEGRNQI